jgi:hypothetical protein
MPGRSVLEKCKAAESALEKDQADNRPPSIIKEDEKELERLREAVAAEGPEAVSHRSTVPHG